MKRDRKITVPRLIAMKAKGRKIAALTAYDYTFARLEDEAGVDLILVGDSAGMVVTGASDTLGVTMDEMIFLTRNVRRGVKHALLVADMPFGSFHISRESTIASAIRFIKEGGVEAVKIEGAGDVLETIRKMTASGIPVMGHLGLTPQSVHSFGGFMLRGNTQEEADRILQDALKLQDAGVFSIVLEKIPVHLARSVSESLDIPTIGIASGPHCDGQILVSYDLLGLADFDFKFVRKYLEGGTLIKKAVQGYIEDTRNNTFPSMDESYEG